MNNGGLFTVKFENYMITLFKLKTKFSISTKLCEEKSTYLYKFYTKNVCLVLVFSICPNLLLESQVVQH